MKIIALVDPASGGHHTAYVRIFSEVLIEKGFCVWVFVPEEENVKEWVQENHTEWLTKQQLRVVPYTLPNRTYPWLGKYNETATILYRWWHLRRTIAKAERENQEKVSLVFMAWLDSFLSGYLIPLVMDTCFSYQWSGLYFHPRHMRLSTYSLKPVPSPSDIDIVLTAQNCRSVAIHDEGIVDSFAERIRKKVILFPEIADDTPPDPENALAVRIRGRADGRLVVGVIGLSRHQGMLTLLRVAQQAPKDRFFFVFVGELTIGQFSDSEQKEVQDFFENLPENCFAHFGRLKEGQEYNSVFTALDVPFLVYENFPSASNRLTKAAIFKKYVLAQNIYCIGEDVQKYNLGYTVDESNVPQCLKAIDELYSVVMQNYSNAKFTEYKNLHSIDRLQFSISQMTSDGNK